MLILSRKVGQELVIGDNVRITIQKLSSNRVTIGISAPDEVRVMRGELESVVRSFEVRLPAGEKVDEPAASEGLESPCDESGATRSAMGTPGWILDSQPLSHLVRQLH